MVNFKTIINPEEFTLFKINKNSIDPFFDRDADYSLSQQLSMFDKNDKFHDRKKDRYYFY
jgi:hypothetical protein